MEQSYQRWPFLPPTMRTPEQNKQWWEHCFHPVLPVVNFAQAPGSTAVTSLPGNGKSVALEYMAQYSQPQALPLYYPCLHWPHGARPKAPAKRHLSQIMAILATEVATHLEAHPELLVVADLSDTQHEFIAWLVEKYLGRRTLCAWPNGCNKRTRLH